MYQLTEDSKSVAVICIHLDFGVPMKRAELMCHDEVAEGWAWSSHDLYFDHVARRFDVRLEDPCGNPLASQRADLR